MTTPVRRSLTAATSDDPRTTLQSVDIATGAVSLVAVMPDNPIFEVFGTTRQQMPPRQTVVDSQGTTSAITISSLSIIPLAPSRAATEPARSHDQPEHPGLDSDLRHAARSHGARRILPRVQQCRAALAADSRRADLRADSGYGPPGYNVVQARSLAMAQQSDPIVMTVQRP